MPSRVKRRTPETVPADAEHAYLAVSPKMQIALRGTHPLRIRYNGAVEPSRSRATDLLSLNYLDREQSWRAGQTVSEYEAVVHVEPTR